MHQNIRISSNRTCKMRVQLTRKPIMCELRVIHISGAEIHRLIHRPSGQNPHKFIKKRVILPLNALQRFCQLL
jgi:hypothetical protein